MKYEGTGGEKYVAGKELGKGGEGTVYELQSHSGLVLKKYNEPLTQQQVNKLGHMVSIRSKEIEAYAAWPADLVTDSTNTIVGFVMKKLTGYLPLHMIFSPMDRKKLFPDKGYNFLVHVARNLATAFFNLHEAGLIVGDVNEGNILISSSGLVAFIDCDSFQVKGRDKYYYCEVGVPRYTPPELLKEGSFEHIVRTVNTDSFSLGVLIFQLLFLGRHPYAGKNKTAADIDEETAIRKREFAYSLENKKKKLTPPNDSFSISNLPDTLVSLFHRAFEQDDRPTPAEWIKALDVLLAGMVTCGLTSLHTYPGQLKECPWCSFKRNRGILYFLDDSYLQAANELNDIERFVNGFKMEQLELKWWNGTRVHKQLTPTPIEKKFRRYKRWRMAASIVSGIIMLIVFLFHQDNGPVLTLAVCIPFIMYLYSPWSAKLKNERQRRISLHYQMNWQLNVMIAEHDHSPDIVAYANGLEALNKLIHDFRALPDEFERRKKVVEERIYNSQLHDFLAGFAIEDHTIPSFGTAKKAALYNGGIRTAADISNLQNTRVPGIGPKNTQVLLSWQRQLSSEFVYIPDGLKIFAGVQQVNSEIAGIKQRLEHLIRKDYQALNSLKLNITNRSNVLELKINDLSVRTYQAMLDRDAFKQFAGWGLYKG